MAGLSADASLVSLIVAHPTVNHSSRDDGPPERGSHPLVTVSQILCNVSMNYLRNSTCPLYNNGSLGRNEVVKKKVQRVHGVYINEVLNMNI